MSRVSQKTDLSPSISGGGGGIDLGKKSEPSVTSGGIGISQEVTSIGGVTVTAGASLEISPIDLGVSYDPSENSVSVAAGAELPGGLLGVGGGVTVDLDTGEVTGGSIGAEGLGLGVNISASKDGSFGVGITLQIPFTPIELELGFGFPPKGKEPTPTPNSPPPPGPFPPGPLPSSGGNTYCTVIVAREYKRWFIYSGEHTHWIGDGSVRVNDEGYKYISGSYKYITSPFTSDSYPEVYPPWRSNSQVDYFSYGTIYGASGQEGKVYNEINQQCGYYYSDRFQIVATTYKVIYSDCPLSDNIPPPPGSSSPPPPFPNPPPRKRNKKMDTCCQETLKFLRAIYKGLGIAKFPGQLPSTIIQEVSKKGEEPAEPSQVPITDFVDLLTWQFERDDERWGQWEIQIDIKDSDITKEGDQGKSVKFPNLAESIAEFEGQLLSIMANVDALVALQVKNLAESGMARQEAIKGYLASKAIIKYMAFKSTEVDIPVPMTFTAGAESISALLEESEGHIKGTDYLEKETLRDVYLDLLQAAAIIRAVHWQKVDTKTDIKSQLLNILKGSVDLASSIAKPPNGNGSEKSFDPENDFEDFIDSVEDGFRNTTGVTDVQNPYGKSPSRRPRIRQIGDNISQAGGSD